MKCSVIWLKYAFKRSCAEKKLESSLHCVNSYTVRNDTLDIKMLKIAISRHWRAAKRKHRWEGVSIWKRVTECAFHAIAFYLVCMVQDSWNLGKKFQCYCFELSDNQVWSFQSGCRAKVKKIPTKKKIQKRRPKLLNNSNSYPEDRHLKR